MISQTAERVPDKVSSLVYLCAMLLQDGQSTIDASVNDPDSQLMANISLDEGAATSSVTGPAVRDLFYGDCSAVASANAMRLLVPEPVGPASTADHVTAARWGSVPARTSCAPRTGPSPPPHNRHDRVGRRRLGARDGVEPFAIHLTTGGAGSPAHRPQSRAGVPTFSRRNERPRAGPRDRTRHCGPGWTGSAGPLLRDQPWPAIGRIGGLHFARPGNRFWKLLHAGGFTDHVLRLQSKPFSRRLASASPTWWIESPWRPASSIALSCAPAANSGGEGKGPPPAHRCRAWSRGLSHGIGRPAAEVGEQKERLAASRLCLLPQPERSSGAIPNARNDGALPEPSRCGSSPEQELGRLDGGSR